MQQNKHHGSSGFLNGFAIGLLVGVGIALLFTTNKGRRILRSLSEEGLDKVSNFDELMQKFERVTQRATSAPEDVDDDLAEEGNDYVPPKKVLLADAEPKVEQKSEAKTVAMPPIHINTTTEERPVTAVDAPDEVSDALAEALKKIDADLAKQAVAEAIEEEIEEEESMHKVKPTRRRFFRGIPKRG